MNPVRWHIYIVDLEPRVGTKPGKQRPCLCIQPTEMAKAGLKSSVVLPLTTNTFKEEVFPFRIKLPKGTCGLKKESEIIVDQILAWDNSLFKDDLGKIPEHFQDRVKMALLDFLDL
jgi:mRNA interferase MazF